MGSLADFPNLPPAIQAQIAAGPALAPPPGVVPNFDNPPNLNAVVHVLYAIWFPMVTLAVLGRIYIRFFSMKQGFVGDYFLVVAYIFFVVGFALSYRVLLFPGFFVHQWNIRLGDLHIFLRAVHLSTVIYIVTICSVKIAILLEWLRIFSPNGTRGLVFWTSHFLIWANVFFYLSVLIANNISCTPYEYIWNKLIAGSCARVDTTDTNLSASVFNFISDLLVLLIPQHVIWKLHMSTKKKVGVSVIFMIGVLGCAAALARLVETVRHATNPDFVYTFSAVSLCSAAELTCGFLVICVPSFPKAFQAFDMNKLKQSLSFWTWTSSQNTLRSTSKKSASDNSSRSGSNPFSRLKSSNEQNSSSDTHQLYPMPKALHKDSTDQSMEQFENLGKVEGGIVRTTHFEAGEEVRSAPNTTTAQHEYRQQWSQESQSW
ncbi:hypothetical protein BJ875DRAFT_516487 [Amylocarpus encephaloides]|uniref:Rhodopsin domain-containing protein n=1 Tax=Amylocarpus encephaloides TaxID=45428 RepID=A0A9P7YDD2_9HELO|nr:hypothetical protein BJ875DRAFT_516487 [Amylocarpus encephaloides]